MLVGAFLVGCGGSGDDSSFEGRRLEGPLSVPLAGLHDWRGDEGYATGRTALDAYDRFDWRDLEPSAGVFEFDAIDDAIAAARARGQRFAFRIRAMRGYEDDTMYFPSDLAPEAWCSDTDDDPSTCTWVLDFNDPVVLDRMAALLSALGAHLGADAPIAFIDVGMYGQYGEWTVRASVYEDAPGGVTPITEASKRAIVDMHVDAFPTERLLVFFLQAHLETILYAHAHPDALAPIGLRTDCLGRDGFYAQWLDRPEMLAMVAERYMVAPVVAEFCTPQGAGFFATAREQAAEFHVTTVGNGNYEAELADLPSAERDAIAALATEVGARIVLDRASWSRRPDDGALDLELAFMNVGNAPLYEPYATFLRIEPLGAEGIERAIDADVTSLAPTGASTTFSATVPLSGLPSGRHALVLCLRDARVDDPTSPRPPLELAIEGRRDDGCYPLGSLVFP